MTRLCFEQYLDTHEIPDPDLLIRDQRGTEAFQLSALAAGLHGVLFYRCFVAGLYKRRTGKRLFLKYNERDRRYGGVKGE